MREDLLLVAKETALRAAGTIIAGRKTGTATIEGYELGGREVKILADRIANEIIMQALSETGISILSEESGFDDRGNEDGLLWIVDPLDGSLNFARNTGPSVVSIALWRNKEPLFGVLCDATDQSLSWGGKNIGAWTNELPLRVTDNIDRKTSILCTGVPARFDVNNANLVQDFTQFLFSFSKVRMFGSAAFSLLKVASGSADAYRENNIMLWDIAAGLALIEGAGGSYHADINWVTNICSIFAANKNLVEKIRNE